MPHTWVQIRSYMPTSGPKCRRYKHLDPKSGLTKKTAEISLGCYKDSFEFRHGEPREPSHFRTEKGPARLSPGTLIRLVSLGLGYQGTEHIAL